jgi:hypothetical protein
LKKIVTFTALEFISTRFFFLVENYAYFQVMLIFSVLDNTDELDFITSHTVSGLNLHLQESHWVDFC